MLELDRVILGDCLEKLAEIPDNTIDVCFADPPFNLDKKYISYRGQQGERRPASSAPPAARPATR